MSRSEYNAVTREIAGDQCLQFGYQTPEWRRSMAEWLRRLRQEYPYREG